MNDFKYRTIDPLILQTLNLNERRMNNILDILHGRQSRRYPKTERKIANHSLIKDRTISAIDREKKVLPPILLNKKKEMQQQVQFAKKTLRKSSNYNVVTNQSLVMQKSEEQLKRRGSHDKKIQQSPQSSPKHGSKERSFAFETVNIQKEYRQLQESKKSQLMQNYMQGKLKHSKSQQINPKDVYRMEIEEIVAEFTPIQGLQQSQKRMRRLKRRHKHLQSFDKSYYSKLNQHDMLVMF